MSKPKPSKLKFQNYFRFWCTPRCIYIDA